MSRAALPDVDAAPGGLRGPAGERIVVVLLFAIAAALGWLRFGLLPKQVDDPRLKFEYDNPMLLAQRGDCVRGQSSHSPGAELCFIVRDRVLRPSQGPESLPGGYEELQQFPPYLIIDTHPAEEGADGCGGGMAEPTLRSLNGFGMDPESQTRVERIVPVWRSFGGEEGLFYEVTIIRYDVPGTWVMYISPDLPVMGIAKMQELREQSVTPMTVWFDQTRCD